MVQKILNLFIIVKKIYHTSIAKILDIPKPIMERNY